VSACERYRDFIEAQLRLRRNAMAIYQDLVDTHGFAAGYKLGDALARKLRRHEPEQFDLLQFLPGDVSSVSFSDCATIPSGAGFLRIARS
jgi:hypothetical protein